MNSDKFWKTLLLQKVKQREQRKLLELQRSQRWKHREQKIIQDLKEVQVAMMEWHKSDELRRSSRSQSSQEKKRFHELEKQETNSLKGIPISQSSIEPNMIQEHRGSGDNVLGNKIVNNHYYERAEPIIENNIGELSENSVLQTLSKINQKSKKGINYLKLANLLAEEKWQQADYETQRIICKLADQEGRSNLEREDIENIPIEDLVILDGLWQSFSNDHFGLSIQSEIWLEEGEKIDKETLKSFSERVGRTKNYKPLSYGQLNFNFKAPKGQFPLIWSVSNLGLVSGDLVSENSLILLEHYNNESGLERIQKTIKTISPKGVDYTKLQELLRQQKWLEADEETKKVMYKVIKGFYEMEQIKKTIYIQPITLDEIDSFSCEDLEIIDQLWVKYSDGRFAFSVQSEIYIDELGATKQFSEEIWYQFCERVGWTRDRAFITSTFQSKDKPTKVAKGHLPSRDKLSFMIVNHWMEGGWVPSMLHRVKTCNLQNIG